MLRNFVISGHIHAGKAGKFGLKYRQNSINRMDHVTKFVITGCIVQTGSKDTNKL